MTYTILIPVYNGAATIGPLVERLLGPPDARPVRIVLVNDGSADDGDRVCRAIHESSPDVVTYVKLAKNFGEHYAVTAGPRYVGGDYDYLVVINDDIRNPPEEATLPARHAFERDHDVVFARYERKHHHLVRNLKSRFNDVAASALLNKPPDPYFSSRGNAAGRLSISCAAIKEPSDERGAGPDSFEGAGIPGCG